jgi:hypothetical protein
VSAAIAPALAQIDSVAPEATTSSVTQTTSDTTAAPIPDESECDSYPDVPINITTRFDEPVYDYDAGIAQIEAMASDQRHSIHENLTLGLTRYMPTLEFGVPVRSVQYPDGVACAHVQHVDVTIGYKDVTVFIAREIPQGTCGFDTIMAHEQKHIDVNRAILAEYTPLIEQRLKVFLHDNGVFREPNLDYASTMLQGKLQQILNEISEQIVTDNRQRQQQVDNPGEYRRITYSCNGQLTGIARRYMTGR